MANSKVALLLRIRLKDGTRTYAPAASARNGKVLPLTALVNGKPERHPEGVYAPRYREAGRLAHRQVGTDLDIAETAKLRLEVELRTRKETSEGKAAEPVSVLPTVPAVPAAPTVRPPTTADERRNRFLEPLATLRGGFIDRHAHSSSDSIYAYTYVTTEFVKLLEQRGKHKPVELDEDDVIAFDRFLELQGNSKSTRSSRYGYVRCFLRYCGLNPSRSDDDDAATGVMSGAMKAGLNCGHCLG